MNNLSLVTESKEGEKGQRKWVQARN